jgi:hypothetical protein
VFGVAFAAVCKDHDNKLEGTSRNLITSCFLRSDDDSDLAQK